MEWAWKEQETYAKQLWALHFGWWDLEFGPVLQRPYKLLRELKIPECAILKSDILWSTVLNNLLKDFL